MDVKPYAVAVVLLSLIASPLAAAPMPLADPITGDDSGWSVSWDESVISVEATEVDLNASTLRIVIGKDFGPVEINGGGEIEFPDALISFTPSGGLPPVSRIIIESETIANNSGVAWDRFDWYIMQPGAADFLVAESAGWSVSPMTVKLWPDAVGNVAHNLRATGGVVADGGVFSPSGGLVIDATGQAPFTLKQLPAPEPSTLAILGAGLCGLLRRRRRTASA